MQKTITIDGREITFKASASIAYHYKAHFNRDLLDIAMPLITSVFKGMVSDDDIDIGAVLEDVQYSIDLTDLYNLIWIMAWVADKSIPEPVEWYETFEKFPGFDIAKELWDIFLPSMLTSEESKKKLMKKAKPATTKKSPQRQSLQQQNSAESTSEN